MIPVIEQKKQEYLRKFATIYATYPDGSKQQSDLIKELFYEAAVHHLGILVEGKRLTKRHMVNECT
jgi:hypothetical protein